MRVLGYEAEFWFWKAVVGEEGAVRGRSSSLAFPPLPEAKLMRSMSVGYWLLSDGSCKPSHTPYRRDVLASAGASEAMEMDGTIAGRCWRLR